MAGHKYGEDSVFLNSVLGTLMGRVLYDVAKAWDLLHIALAVALLALVLVLWHKFKRRWLIFSAMLVGTFLGMVLVNR